MADREAKRTHPEIRDDHAAVLHVLFGHGKLMSLHVSNDIIVYNGIAGSSGGDLSLSLWIKTGAQSSLG